MTRSSRRLDGAELDRGRYHHIVEVARRLLELGLANLTALPAAEPRLVERVLGADDIEVDAEIDAEPGVGRRRADQLPIDFLRKQREAPGPDGAHMGRIVEEEIVPRMRHHERELRAVGADAVEPENRPPSCGRDARARATSAPPRPSRRATARESAPDRPVGPDYNLSSNPR